MPQAHSPTYAQTEAFQRTLSQLQREQYNPLIADMVWLDGHPINRLFMPSSDLAMRENGGLNQQMITRRARAARNSSNPLLDTPKGDSSSSDKIKIRWDTNNPANNDFVSIEATVTLPIFERMFSGNEGIVNILEDSQRTIFETIDYRTAVLMHSDRSGLIWSSTDSLFKAAFNSSTYSGASAWSNGATIGSIQITSGLGIGVAREGVLIDIYDGSTLVASNLRITQTRIPEDAFEFEVTSDSNVSVLDDIDSISGAVSIYFAQSKGEGFKASLGELFKTSYANDNWFDARDRNSSGNGHFIPQRTRVGAAQLPLTKRMLDDILQAIGIRTNYQQTTDPVFVAGIKAMDNLRQDVGEAVITHQSADSQSGDYTVGELALGYIHPTMGRRLALLGDNYANENVAYVIHPDDTKKYYAEQRGPMTTSDWKQRAATTAGSGWSKFYDMSVQENSTPFMNSILRSGAVFNIE